MYKSTRLLQTKLIVHSSQKGRNSTGLYPMATAIGKKIAFIKKSSKSAGNVSTSKGAKFLE